jgi:hypothetical protein
MVTRSPRRPPYAKLKIDYDKGTVINGVCVWLAWGLSVGRGHRPPDVWHASRDGVAVPGWYATQEAAVYAATHLSNKDIIEKLGHIYDPKRGCRAVTMWDVRAVHKAWRNQ